MATSCDLNLAAMFKELIVRGGELEGHTEKANACFFRMSF